jgi:Nucleoside 2-deoxyribosyltransferase
LAWTGEDASSDEYGKIALAELKGVRDADVLVVMLPGGFGTHVEIGAALALGKPVIVHAPDRKTLATPYPCVFHYHPRVKLFVLRSSGCGCHIRVFEPIRPIDRSPIEIPLAHYRS